ncbi:NAD(P)H-dependent flavin oxidoreductase [Taklimakanibacter lacteus]|uniref:NAD(P)H-dependent flavin oxidoreductase n=1 Tax=Taklimakanibacter lacteus TaxID=2268456 RepID=UPI000E66D770
MWPDRRLCQLLGLEHPIIQAPMAGSATPELAAAVSNAGGLGSLGCSEMTLDDLTASVANLRARTNRSFNLNFFTHPAPRPDQAVFAQARERMLPWYRRLGLGEPAMAAAPQGPGFDDARLATLLDLKPRVVSFHFGVPDRASVSALKAAGIMLMSTATTVAEARALETAGIDVVIAQGFEAGGHRGSHKPRAPADGVGTLALVPQIADAVRLPVVAAGGIGDGRGIAAAFALGAAGVQMGTGFLSCPEAGTDAVRRAMLRDATETDTMMTNAFSGRAARAVRSDYADEMERMQIDLPDFPSMYDLSAPLLQSTKPSEVSFLLYGQAARLNRELPAAELVARYVAEAEAVFARLRTGQA